jgi:ABC-type multidrug transport system fused ATPase/permease subunit
MVTRPSCAGKSSLLALLLRFTEPTSGRIEAAGRDLSSIPVSSWRRQIAWVPQSPYLFADTVADNIALGNPGATRPEIRRAARQACAEEFIAALADGFDTALTERAPSLSAGSRSASHTTWASRCTYRIQVSAEMASPISLVPITRHRTDMITALL